jgi:hypothetical protein
VAYSRRHRFLSTFVSEMPGPKSSVLGQVVGGWQLSGVLLFQSGPFLTVTVPGAAPAGIGFPNLIGNRRADLNPSVPLYPDTKNAQRWINPAVCRNALTRSAKLMRIATCSLPV